MEARRHSLAVELNCERRARQLAATAFHLSRHTTPDSVMQTPPPHALESQPLTRDLPALGEIDFDALKPLHANGADNKPAQAAAAAAPQKPLAPSRLVSAPRASAAKVEFDYDYASAAPVAPKDLSEYAVPDVEVISNQPDDDDLSFLRWLQPQYRLDPAQLQLHKLIGRGAFGVVYSGTLHGQEVAVKLVKRSRPITKPDPFSSGSGSRSGDTTVPASASSSLSTASLVSASSSSSAGDAPTPYAFSCSIADSALLQSLPAHIQPLQQLVQEILVLHYLCTENHNDNSGDPHVQEGSEAARAIQIDGLSSPILRFLGAAYSADALMMVSRLYPLGSVESCLLARPPPLAVVGARSRVPKSLPPAAALAAPFDACLPLRLRIVLQVAQALRFCHEHHVIHHDVAARNLLLDAQWHCALADFGLASYDLSPVNSNLAVINHSKQGQPSVTTMQRAASEPLQEREHDATMPPATSTSLSLPASLSALPRSTPVCELVSVRHAAPESIRGSASKAGVAASNEPSMTNSASLDCWSFAVTAWEVLAGRQPFETLPNFQVAFRVVEEGARLPLDGATWPPQLCALMQACWATEPERRPSMQAAVTCLERCIAALPQPPSFTLPTRRSPQSPPKPPKQQVSRPQGPATAASISASGTIDDAWFPQHYTQTDPSIVKTAERAHYEPVPQPQPQQQQQQQQQHQQPQAQLQSSYSPVPSLSAAPSSSYSSVAQFASQGNDSLNSYAPAPAPVPAPAHAPAPAPAAPPAAPPAPASTLVFGAAPQAPPPPAALAPPPPPPMLAPSAPGAAGPDTGAAGGVGAGAGMPRRRSAAMVPPVADLLSTRAALTKTPSAPSSQAARGGLLGQSLAPAGFVSMSATAQPLMKKKSGAMLDSKPSAAPVPPAAASFARKSSITMKSKRAEATEDMERTPVAQAAATRDEEEDEDDEDEAGASTLVRKGGSARSSSSRGGRGGAASGTGSRAHDASVLSKQSRTSRAASLSSSATATSEDDLPAPKSAGPLARLMSFFGGGKKKAKQQPQRETQQAQVGDAPSRDVDGAAGGAGGAAAAAPRSKLRDAQTDTDTASPAAVTKKPVARPTSSSSAAAATAATSKVAAPAAPPLRAPLGAKTMMVKKKSKADSVSVSAERSSFSSASSASSASASPATNAATSSSLAAAVAAAAAPDKDQEKVRERATSKDERQKSEEASARAPAAPTPAPAPAPSAAAAPLPDVSRAPSLIQSRRSMASLGSEDDEGFFDDDALPMMLQSEAVITPEPAVEGAASFDEVDAPENAEDEEDERQVEMAPGGASVREEVATEADLPQVKQESPFAFAPTLRAQMTEAKQQAHAASSSSAPSVAASPRMIPFSTLRSVHQINAEVLEASIPSANDPPELVAVVGRVIDVDLFESLRTLLSDPSATGLLMPVEALVEPSATTPGQAGLVLVRRSGVLEDAATGSPLTLHASLQSAQGLGSCFQPGSSSIRPLLVALADYVRAVQWLLQHDAPTMVGGLHQIPFLPSSLNASAPASSASSSSPPRVQLPASSLLLLHRSLCPHLFDSAASPAFLEARSQELQAARYLAPESVRDGTVGTEATEVWALGCTLWESVHQGRFRAYEDSHPDTSINQLLLGVATGQIELSRPKLSGEGGGPRQQQVEELARLVEACTQRDPAARPSLASVLQQLQAML